ncbi:hypothetical protein Vretimale_8690 [Volvox reticuliferus]|uniref:Uncharacterized protein n=1 Tax=Volvox reticuliferus TaxID=1737510 RepID=A0A8J4GBA4_9CHLO|nr:hypothetical protein Vretifemale_6376 [Volvox reticuliferus]GIM04058.1 hypothetical protein Vretimale_8690 [Volvox reticuliferus]
MVWASQEPVDDSAPGIDSVRAKPLKKRCSSRAGLSRYYSSKSQSFSSLDLVQCTPFGTSAMALAKRPASFDLRRGSPRRRLSQVTSACARCGNEEEASMSIPDEEDGDQDAPDRCPCNDTIFSDPEEAFVSPEGSPNASPLQMCYSGGLSNADIGSYQQYLTHLSTLPLPLLSPFSTNDGGAAAAGGGGSTRTGGLSSALSCSSSSGCSGKALSSGSSSSSSSTAGGSFCVDSSVAPTARLWHLASAHIATPYSAGLDRPDSCVTGSTGPMSKTWPQYPGPGPLSALEAVTHTLLQSCGDNLKIISVGSGCGRAANVSGSGATYPLVSQATAFGAGSSTAGSGSRPRSCLSSSGYMYPVLHSGGPAAMTTMALGNSAPTPMVPAMEPSYSNGSSSANGTVPGLGRKLAMGITHRRLRAAQAAGLVAVHSARHAAAGLWGSTEDMIASLTLSDRQLQQQQHLRGSRGPAPNPVARVGDGPCWFASSGPRWQQPEHRSGESCPFGFGQEVVFQSVGPAPGAAATAALSPAGTRAAAAAASPTLSRGSDGSSVSGVSFSSEFGGIRALSMQLPQQPHQEPWLCCAAPPVSASPWAA